MNVYKFNSYLQYILRFFIKFPVLGLLSPLSQEISYTTNPTPTLSLFICIKKINKIIIIMV